MNMTPNDVVDYAISVLDNLTEISDSYNYEFFIKEGAREKIDGPICAVIFTEADSEDFMYEVQEKVQMALGEAYVISINEPVGNSILIGYIGSIAANIQGVCEVCNKIISDTEAWQTTVTGVIHDSCIEI